jgi:hypothetical protein
VRVGECVGRLPYLSECARINDRPCGRTVRMYDAAGSACKGIKWSRQASYRARVCW